MRWRTAVYPLYPTANPNNEQAAVGFIYVALPLAKAEAAIRQLQVIFLLFGAGLILICAMLGWQAIRRAFVPLTEAAAAVFPVRQVSADEAVDLGHGKKVPATGAPGLHAAVDPAGRLVALVADAGSSARVEVGFPA